VISKLFYNLTDTFVFLSNVFYWYT